MAKGILRAKKLRQEEQYTAVNDHKLRLSLAALTDKYSDAIRDYIYRCYQDDELALIYRAIRRSGVYQHGSKNKVRRKWAEFPNGYVYDFCDTVLSQLYGPNWLDNTKARNHELVKPWWVVEKL